MMKNTLNNMLPIGVYSVEEYMEGMGKEITVSFYMHDGEDWQRIQMKRINRTIEMEYLLASHIEMLFWLDFVVDAVRYIFDRIQRGWRFPNVDELIAADGWYKPMGLLEMVQIHNPENLDEIARNVPIVPIGVYNK